MSVASDMTETVTPAANGGENIVEVRNITKFYNGDVHALDSINLGFPAGRN